MSQSRASAAIQKDPLDVAIANERLTQAKANSAQLNGLVRTGVGTLLGVLVVLMAVSEIFHWTLRNEIQKKQLTGTNEILTSTRAREQTLLTQYQWVKKSDGVVRIPVERAKQLVIADYSRATVANAAPSGSAHSTSPAAKPAGFNALIGTTVTNQTANPAGGVDP